MTTNCEHIARLLPAYAEDGLDAGDKARVDAHVSACEVCRESLAFFTQLEGSLAERHTLRPAASASARRVVERMGLRPQRHAVPLLTRFPAMVSVALVISGVAALLLRGWMQELAARVAMGSGEFMRDLGTAFSVLLERLPAGMEAVAAVNEWILTTVYFGVLALTLLTGSWMVLRYARE
ncbi:MAG: zf-HC2 domain-containing protein [Candidatus Krumholzibacteria bacterium]|nr:zf-HC2 domain-containing protein [Candidatus Krumholzibacteria bacterium]